MAAALGLGGCATGYQPSGLAGGFTETQLAPDVWRVTFEGNGYTRPEQSADFALLRCAELALQNGYPHFAILREETGARRGVVTTPLQATTVGRTTTFSGGQVYAFSAPSATNRILLLREPATDGSTYDAAFLVRSLKAKYKVAP